MVNLIYYNIKNLNFTDYLSMKRCISKERRKKAEKYRHFEDTVRCVLAEVLVAYGYYDCYHKIENFALEDNEYGKPFLISMPEFKYNISHSGEWVVVAYGDIDIGVDVEKIEGNWDSVYKKCLTEFDKVWVDRCDEISKNKKMAIIWTLIEAYLKYLGVGLFKAMDTFYVDFYNCTVVDESKALNVYTQSFDIENNYVCSICCTNIEITK